MGKSWNRETDSEKGNYDYLMGADLDTDNPEVIQETRNWGKWYQDTVHMDGFRMDAIKHVFMSDESENASTDRIAGDSGWQYNLDKNVEFFKEFNGKLKSKYPHCFLLGEQLDGNADNVAPFYAGMDSLFDFSMHYSLPDRIKSGNASAVANSANANAQSTRPSARTE